MNKLVVFDFGETLAYYGGTRLSWSEHYEDALQYSANLQDFQFNRDSLIEAQERLEHYNTRSNPRLKEVTSKEIFGEIADNLGPQTNLDRFVSGFFMYFKRNIIVYDETITVLRELQSLSVHTAILTDMPYGMDTYLLLEDLESTGIDKYIEQILSSVDVGYRKPDKRGLLNVLERFGIDKADTIFVGNELKDIECAHNAGVEGVLLERGDKNSFNLEFDYEIINSLSEVLPLISGT